MTLFGNPIDIYDGYGVKTGIKPIIKPREKREKTCWYFFLLART